MEELSGPLDRATAVEYASWFRALADATRVQIVSLLAALAASTEAAGIWTIQSSLFPENTASVQLHEKAGFRVIGTRERVARHHGRWRDTVLMERRSKVTGTG